jgi:calcium-dependent protein kinase
MSGLQWAPSSPSLAVARRTISVHGRKPSKDKPKKPDASSVHTGQHRASLQVKAGGFSVGAFAADNRGDLEEFYKVEKKVIGEGSYGSVVKCQNKDTHQWRALKAINKKLVKNAEQFKEEMAIMKLLDHPNIVRLYETFEDARTVYLVLELCTGGELFDRIVEVGNFTEKVAARCVQQMLRAVNYMHMNYIMHRDLKPENWLLSSNEEIKKADLKLIDFGLSKRFTPGDFASTKAGTPYYVAPEVLDGRYAEKSDVWSIGVIMYISSAALHLFLATTPWLCWTQ